MAEPVQFALEEHQAKRLASYAVRGNDWDTLDLIEAALQAAGFNEPTVMDIYGENATLQRRVRELEARCGKDPR